MWQRRGRADHLGQRLVGARHPVEAFELGEPDLDRRADAWHALAQELNDRGLWEVGELPEPERLAWARRLGALSEAFASPAPGDRRR